jgi:arylsulfatase A-like enzyme
MHIVQLLHHALYLRCCIHAGYDFINRAEVTAGRFMQAAGYKTAHFGKW